MAYSLAQRAAKLRVRLDSIADELEGMGPTKAGGLPDAKGSGMIGHVAYRQSLLDEQERLSTLLALWGDPDLETGNTGGDAERYVDV
jgi:hypothetical protein